ncbi:4307_t:CDS:2 [Dentiscutata erythropus]|uniref:4307_t:CDS:1 n=1 Tax=Dentiscutata erythropus TaxID=1348616 RepID=A0A9N9ECF1_9GLOM|nr:4307_t:CDS:2 [Dentiscutata erythropus]
MNLILIYINVEKEKNICIKNIDKCDGLIQQRVDSNKDKEIAERDEDISVIISKNVSNNESKSDNSNQARLEKKNFKENNIESNESIGKVDDRGLDDLEAKVDQLLSDMKNSDGKSADI